MKKILFVEDDDDVRLIGTLALETGGFEVVAVPDGQEAVRKAPAIRADLILLDVMMPGMDGTATLRELRLLEATRATPVVFMTAKVQPHEVRSYRELGALDVILKPFDPMVLPETIRRILERPSNETVESGKQMAALNRKYARELPEKIGLIGNLWDAANRPGDSSDSLDRLLWLVHRLAGSAQSFGFAATGGIACELEDALEKLGGAVPDAVAKDRIGGLVFRLKESLKIKPVAESRVPVKLR